MSQELASDMLPYSHVLPATLISGSFNDHFLHDWTVVVMGCTNFYTVSVAYTLSLDPGSCFDGCAYGVIVCWGAEIPYQSNIHSLVYPLYQARNN